MRNESPIRNPSDRRNAVNTHPNVTLVVELVATLVLTFGPMLLAVGDVVRQSL